MHALLPSEFRLVDNSGSMTTCNGQRIVETSTKYRIKMHQCTQWKEIQDTVEYHVRLAGLVRAPSIFRVSGANSG